jgi:hypothetical protein
MKQKRRPDTSVTYCFPDFDIRRKKLLKNLSEKIRIHSKIQQKACLRIQ